MRTYDQYCGIAKALDVLGQRWTPLILRELLLGPRRYSELQRALPGITTNLLAARIQHLEAEGLVAGGRRQSDGRNAWSLTDLGEAARPALLALGAFGSRWMKEIGDDHVSGRWFVVSLQRRYRGGAARSYEVGLEIDGEPFRLRLLPDGLESWDGWPDEPDLVVRGSVSQVVELIVGTGAGTGSGTASAPDEFGLEVEGDLSVLSLLQAGVARLAGS